MQSVTLDTEARVVLTRRPEGESVVMRQDWDSLLFLHWRVSPEAIQALLPPGLTVDTFDGDAYIGLVPFLMRNVRPVWAPAVPGLSHFAEVNVRTYVHAHGVPGVWFFSLDAANPIAVALARALFHLPYYVAAMEISVEPKNNTISYISQRRHASQPHAECMVRYTPTGDVHLAIPGSLDYFLCERYVLYAHRNGRLYRGRVYHTSYPLQSTVLHEFSDALIYTGTGLRNAETPPEHIAYAGGVSVEVFKLHAV